MLVDVFDEEFLRQSFYQNLHPNLYQTQFDNNERLDLMKVIYAVRDREPGALAWPLDDLGRESFKLDRLAPANGFTNHDTHDALGDVEATIHIASLIRKRAPAVWDQCLSNRDKHQVDRLLQSGDPVRLIERFGAAPPRSYLGVYAGTNPQNRNSVAFLDLDLCDASIIDANDRDIAKAVTISPKLIRTIAINKVPNVFTVINPSAAHNSLAQLVAAQPEFQKRVGQALADRYADREPAQHVEQLIYDGFYSPDDKQVLEHFTAADWREHARPVAQLNDQRLKQLGMRLPWSCRAQARSIADHGTRHHSYRMRENPSDGSGDRLAAGHSVCSSPKISGAQRRISQNSFDCSHDALCGFRMPQMFQHHRA